MTIPLRGPTTENQVRGRKLLLRALVAVQFSPILKIADTTGAGIADFQEEVRDRYPELTLEYEDMLQLEVRADGVVQPHHQRLPVWRMFDETRNCRLSLTRQQFALEVKGEGYTNWADFSSRVQAVVGAITQHFKPTRVQRIGVRYVNGASVDGSDPRNECAKELVSISGEQDLIQSDLSWRFPVDEGFLLLRSGMLAPKTSYDPGVFDANPTDRMWYLDIDVINERDSIFDGGEICQSILRQVKRAHEIYRWAMPGAAGSGKV